MGKVIGVIAVKGGVGKTSVSSSLAADLANNHGKKVLLIDANYSAPNVGLYMDIVKPEKTIHDILSDNSPIKSAIHTSYGVDVIPGSFIAQRHFNPLKLKDKIQGMKEKYDFIILDSAPGMNEEVLSTVLASDNLFIVTTPDFPTLSCSFKAAKLAKNRGKEVDGIIINKIRDPNYEINLEDIENFVEAPVVAKIPDEKAHVRALFTRVPMSLYEPKSKFAKEIDKIATALTGKNEKVSFWKTILPYSFKREEVNRQMLKESFYSSVFEE
jgi:septum site-determining protein MinD